MYLHATVFISVLGLLSLICAPQSGLVTVRSHGVAACDLCEPGAHIANPATPGPVATIWHDCCGPMGPRYSFSRNEIEWRQKPKVEAGIQEYYQEIQKYEAGKTNGAWKTNAHYFGTVLAKVPKDEDCLENEGNAYKDKSVIGFLLELLDGRKATKDDQDNCKNTLWALHGVGFLSGDVHKDQFFTRRGDCLMFDFEAAEETADYDAFEKELREFDSPRA
ncbi:Uu.00g042310.m01.CDS01 [Anthostomella pinea]|uniref:Uu.00g042310.m01.CDS01 n=1 Tax=Anthostomella pinea TaxID=933095 RepID=A0AAI8YE88_9PEZI|nr:Uu.00g042310.m01.CDS01 [Anthostomella pinea]